MDTDRSAFVTWLRETAAAAGYDPNVRGGIAALAKAAGIDAAPVSRAMSGEMVPKIDTQRALAQAMGVEPREMFVRSGTILASDLPSEDDRATPAADLDLAEVARSFGIAEDRIPMFVASIEAVVQAYVDTEGK